MIYISPEGYCNCKTGIHFYPWKERKWSFGFRIYYKQKLIWQLRRARHVGRLYIGWKSYAISKKR